MPYIRDVQPVALWRLYRCEAFEHQSHRLSKPDLLERGKSTYWGLQDTRIIHKATTDPAGTTSSHLPGEKCIKKTWCGNTRRADPPMTNIYLSIIRRLKITSSTSPVIWEARCQDNTAHTSCCLYELSLDLNEVWRNGLAAQTKKKKGKPWRGTSMIKYNRQRKVQWLQGWPLDDRYNL